MPSHHAFHNNSVDSESGVLVRGRPMPNMRGKEEITASVPIVSGKKDFLLFMLCHENLIVSKEAGIMALTVGCTREASLQPAQPGHH